MKALSIKQPWASLIAHGIKDIENRTWKTNFRGRIFIHASAKSMVKKVNETSLREIGFSTKMIEDANKKLFAFMYHQDLKITSAIIGEVDIVDCVINHDSIWAEKTIYDEDDFDKPDPKPIYNWVLANPVLYDKPILNVKGKLSFWNWEGCEQTCESCEKDFDIDTMQRDGDDNFFCIECAHELFPVMQKEYEEMVANGEIEPEDD